MTSLARWSFRHRRIVLVAWLVLLFGLGAVSAGLGPSFKDDFKLPDTESKQALDILQRDFPAASGESGQIVVRARSGTV
ncbi:MAG: putative drug exporter of the superfamily, partial [Frankiaceae bacterium]|nr:putative drug exporter of the superfamily [Frankiaceae bacterium]